MTSAGLPAAGIGIDVTVVAVAKIQKACQPCPTVTGDTTDPAATTRFESGGYRRQVRGRAHVSLASIYRRATDDLIVAALELWMAAHGAPSPAATRRRSVIIGLPARVRPGENSVD